MPTDLINGHVPGEVGSKRERVGEGVCERGFERVLREDWSACMRGCGRWYCGRMLREGIVRRCLLRYAQRRTNHIPASDVGEGEGLVVSSAGLSGDQTGPAEVLHSDASASAFRAVLVAV